MSPRPTKPRPEPPSELLPLGDALSFLRVLWAVTHGLESRSKRMLATLGVTGPQRLVLRLVGHQGRISAGQLAEALHVHPSSLTGLLKRLENAGLLHREADPRDGRRALFELTPAGLRLNRQRHGTIEAAVESTLARQPAERVATTKALLSALAQTLDSAPRAARSERHPASSAKSARTSR